MQRSNFDPKSIAQAARVSKFMMELCEKHFGTDRYKRAHSKGIPFGDLAYGAALAHWYANSRPAKAIFSTAPGEIECPCLMEFKDEISAEFGLKIMTREEAEEWDRLHQTVVNHKVFDWGPN